MVWLLDGVKKFEDLKPFRQLVPVALLVASRYVLPGYGDRRVWVQGPARLAGSLCQVIAAYALRLNSRAGTEGSTVSSLILGLEILSISRCLNH